MQTEGRRTEPTISGEGCDELNLAIFPIALLSDKALIARQEKTIEVIETGSDENGRPIERKWTVMGSSKYGLPMSSDNEILMCLLELTKEKSNFEDRNVALSCYEMLRRMGWRDEGRSYHRVKEGLARLKGVSIVCENAFWNSKVRRYSTTCFGIIDDFYLTSPKPETDGSRDRESSRSYVSWNQILFESFKQGNLKQLDLALWRSWKYPITKRLHRYLNMRFCGTSRLQIEISRMAALIPLPKSQTKYPSGIKRQIEKAAEEMLKAGYIDGFKYRSRAEGDYAVFIRDRKSAPKAAELSSAEIDLLVKRLSALGIREFQARKIVAEAEAGFISHWLDHLGYIDDLKRPVAYLVRAIKENWQVPSKAIEAAKKVQAQKLEKQRREEEEEKIREDREKFFRMTPEEKAAKRLARWLLLQKSLKRDPSAEATEKKRLEFIEEYRNCPSAEK